MIGLALGVASSLCWACLDAVRKALSQHASPTALAIALLLGQVPFFFLWMAIDGSWITAEAYWVPAVTSMAMNALANVLFMRSVQMSPLSRTIPFLSLTPVFSAMVAVPLLQELPNVMHWAGIALVVAGAVVLNSDLEGALVRTLFKERGVPYMIAVAFLWAMSTALDKVALPHASPAAHAFLLTSGSAGLLLIWMGVWGKPSELRAVLKAPPRLLIAMVGFAVGALALQMLALQWLWVSVVETLKRGFGVVGSVMLGRLVFKEPVTATKLIALVLMVAGTAILALT